MRRSTSGWLILFGAMATAAGQLEAQSGGYVVTLGRDTVQVEQFVRTRNVIRGTIVIRSPAVRLIRYAISLAESGRLEAFEQQVLAPDGRPPGPGPGRVTIHYTADSVIRDAFRGEQPVNTRFASAQVPYPLGTIPMGNSFVVFELALVRAPGASSLADSGLYRLAPSAAQTRPSRTNLLFSSADSVVVDYFGQGSFLFRFDRAGHLSRSEWTNTTYKVIVEQADDVDADAVAHRWQTQEAAGRRFGALSPRDTVRVSLGGASLWVDYSRPSKRGRQVWGGVVPSNTVWRLGADLATQFRTDKDLLIGDTPVPAGTYTLWMVPHAGSSELVINTQTGTWGTQYNAARDLGRVPMQRSTTSRSLELLSISVRDGRLWIEWDDAAYSVAVTVR